jgi:hypothetical protein
MVNTIPDNTETATINEKGKKEIIGTYITKYGSKKMYSDIIDRGINKTTKIMQATMTY